MLGLVLGGVGGWVFVRMTGMTSGLQTTAAGFVLVMIVASVAVGLGVGALLGWALGRAAGGKVAGAFLGALGGLGLGYAVSGMLAGQIDPQAHVGGLVDFVLAYGGVYVLPYAVGALAGGGLGAHVGGQADLQ